MKRNFVHVDDLCAAILAALDNPRARQADVQHLHGRAGRLRRAGRVPGEDAQAAVGADSRRPTDSTWLDNSKAKFLLGWRPRYDLARLIDAAYDYQRAADDPRVIWYPG